MSEVPINPNADTPQRDWAGLPNDLVELIADKIESSADYLRFAAVCVPWLSIARDNLSKHNTKFCHQAPLLLIPDKHKHKWRAYDAMKELFLGSKLRVPYERRFCGSLEGWLFGVNKDSTVTLHKPSLPNSAVHLPCIFPCEIEPGMEREPGFIDPVEISDYHVKKAIVKSDEKAQSNELTVVAIYGPFNELAYIRHGKDATWSMIDARYADKPYVALDVLHYKNQFYAINYRDVLVSFNVTDSATAIEVAALTPETEGSDLESDYKYLVKSPGGELLLVKRFMNWSADGSRVTESFSVFRFDINGKKWIELKSLGDTALFLGDNSSISVLASSFAGCQPNCIYFTHDNEDGSGWRMICDLGVYNMESKSFKLHYTIGSTALRKMSKRPPIWFAPTISL